MQRIDINSDLSVLEKEVKNYLLMKIFSRVGIIDIAPKPIYFSDNGENYYFEIRGDIGVHIFKDEKGDKKIEVARTSLILPSNFTSKTPEEIIEYLTAGCIFLIKTRKDILDLFELFKKKGYENEYTKI